MKSIIKLDECLLLTNELALCMKKHFPASTSYLVEDIKGEEHIYTKDEHGKPMFDMLISTARKFTFIWYYIHPSKGIKMVGEMKDISLKHKRDFVLKIPNVPKKKSGYPAIVRWGKKPAGISLKRFIVKTGNPQLSKEVYSESNLNTYRDYNWHTIPNALDKILEKARLMAIERLGDKNKQHHKNIRGYLLYAGCAWSYLYPQIGFGMRDIDVEVIFSPAWYTNTRNAFTRNCEITEFGSPEYFKWKTRWLDLMWNSLHSETGNFKADVNTYISEMRSKSDRWATMSQRPFIDLSTKKVVFEPNWIKKLKKSNLLK